MNNANIYAKDHEGRIPIHIAAMSNKLDIVVLFINQGVDINIQSDDIF